MPNSVLVSHANVKEHALSHNIIVCFAYIGARSGRWLLSAQAKTASSIAALVITCSTTHDGPCPQGSPNQSAWRFSVQSRNVTFTKF